MSILASYPAISALQYQIPHLSCGIFEKIADIADIGEARALIGIKVHPVIVAELVPSILINVTTSCSPILLAETNMLLIN